VPNPDILGREKILKVHMRKVQIAPDVNAHVIARGTPGFSGADLANLVNEAALLAARKNKRFVTMAEFEESKDKVMMGTERRSMVMTEDEKKLTAYHEAGHALVALHAPGHDPLHKVTIIPRGRALGMTLALPERDRYGYTKKELDAKLMMMFGGRVAEEIVFGKNNVTTGAADDIRQATDLARRMVTEWGMSDKLGPLRYHDNEEEVFLGHSVTQRKNLSDATAKVIDEEIRRFVDGGQKSARKIITERIDDLHKLAKGLLEYETLSGEDIEAVLNDQPVVRPTDEDDASKDEGRRASVPSSGRKRKASPGKLEPEPQPGS
ncbi:MAG: cell division protein FtsH, partial [Proteobacteria bacterium]|nr:cell division protein FtsH [Pseudomonadota bacterium]